MASYIQSLSNRDGDDIYPVTTAAAVYVQTQSSSGTYTQQSLDKKLEEMETNFTDGCSTIVTALKELGVTPENTTPAGIAAAIKQMYEDRYAAGQESVTVTCTMEGRKATATTSTGKTATAEAPLGTGNGILDMTLTPEGATTVTEYLSEGYYYGGTIVADGTDAFNACKTALSGAVTVTSGLDAEAEERAYLDTTFSGTASIKDGVLSLTISSSGTARSVTWKDGSPDNTYTASDSRSKTGTKSFI